MNSGMAVNQIKLVGGICRSALKELLRNDPLRMAGATAFFTTFALPPILVILIQLMRIFINPETIRQKLFASLSDIVGPEAVEQIVSVLQSLRGLANNWLMTIAGFIFLLFVATTLFKIISGSLNQLWNIRPVAKTGSGLRTRAKSVLVIIIAGVLFMIGVVAEAAQAFIGNYIFQLSPLLSAYFNSLLSPMISFVVVLLWFAMLFRYLPDGKPRWKIAFSGALLTGVLFTVGKIILHLLLSYSNINTVYGTSAAVVLLLLFVFYTSLILYYGAVFTKLWAVYKKTPIRPMPHARLFRMVEAEYE